MLVGSGLWLWAIRQWQRLQNQHAPLQQKVAYRQPLKPRSVSSRWWKRPVEDVVVLVGWQSPCVDVVSVARVNYLNEKHSGDLKSELMFLTQSVPNHPIQTYPMHPNGPFYPVLNVFRCSSGRRVAWLPLGFSRCSCLSWWLTQPTPQKPFRKPRGLAWRGALTALWVIYGNTNNKHWTYCLIVTCCIISGSRSVNRSSPKSSAQHLLEKVQQNASQHWRRSLQSIASTLLRLHRFPRQQWVRFSIGCWFGIRSWIYGMCR